jgi:tetratricopeptide (TPR) repeat protein
VATWAVRAGAPGCLPGRLDRAIGCLDQSLRICRESGNLFGEAVAISNLGEAYYRAGAPGAAIKFYERSLVIHREMRDRCREAETLWRLGWVRDALGQPAQAAPAGTPPRRSSKSWACHLQPRRNFSGRRGGEDSGGTRSVFRAALSGSGAEQCGTREAGAGRIKNSGR